MRRYDFDRNNLTKKVLLEAGWKYVDGVISIKTGIMQSVLVEDIKDIILTSNYAPYNRENLPDIYPDPRYIMIDKNNLLYYLYA